MKLFLEKQKLFLWAVLFHVSCSRFSSSYHKTSIIKKWVEYSFTPIWQILFTKGCYLVMNESKQQNQRNFFSCMVSFIAQNQDVQKLKMTSLLLDLCYYFQSLILFRDRLDLEKGWHWIFFLEDFASFYTSIPQNTWQIGSRFHLLGFTWGIFSRDLSLLIS